MRRLEVVHRTEFTYSTPIEETIMEVRLRPVDGDGQRCVEFKLEVEPAPALREYTDGHGNRVHYFNHRQPLQTLVLTSRSVVEGRSGTGFEPGDGLVADFLRFRAPVTESEGVIAIAREHGLRADDPADVRLEKLDDLTRRIHSDFAYDRTVTDVHSTVEEVLRLRAGVCQDFAHLLIAVARAGGVPARYVSGYIHVPGPDGVMVGASHAWAEMWVPGHGWAGYDATHPVRTSSNHVRVAVGRDYRDAAPTRGVYVGLAEGDMSVKVTTRELESTGSGPPGS